MRSKRVFLLKVQVGICEQAKPGWSCVFSAQEGKQTENIVPEHAQRRAERELHTPTAGQHTTLYLRLYTTFLAFIIKFFSQQKIYFKKHKIWIGLTIQLKWNITVCFLRQFSFIASLFVAENLFSFWYNLILHYKHQSNFIHVHGQTCTYEYIWQRRGHFVMINKLTTDLGVEVF